MISNEVLILFVATLVVAVLVLSALYNQVQAVTEKGTAVSKEVTDRALRDFSIASVVSENGETNIYVYGVSGEINLYKAVVTIDANQYDPVVTPVRDYKNNGILDPDDLYVLTVPAVYDENQCLRIYVSGIITTYGTC